MKKLIIACILLVSAGATKGQIMAAGPTRENSTKSNSSVEPQHDNEFANTEVNTDHGKITLTELPELKKATWAIVTDATGTVVTQKRVRATDNTVDLHRLPKGEMYFLTLVYRNKSKKGFVLHL